MEQNIAWNYPKGLINFITAFILIQAIVMGILIFLYADSFFDINEGDGIIIPDEIFVEYFNIICAIAFVIFELISFCKYMEFNSSTIFLFKIYFFSTWSLFARGYSITTDLLNYQ